MYLDKDKEKTAAGATKEAEAEVMTEEEELELEDDVEDAAPEEVEEEGVAEDEGKVPAKTNPEGIFPILIRCAEARGDQRAVSEYEEEYDAQKERLLEEEAKEVIVSIENGVHSGALFSASGLILAPFELGVLAKVAELFKGEITDGAILVDGLGASVLRIAEDGEVRLQPKG